MNEIQYGPYMNRSEKRVSFIITNLLAKRCRPINA